MIREHDRNETHPDDIEALDKANAPWLARALRSLFSNEPLPRERVRATILRMDRNAESECIDLVVQESTGAVYGIVCAASLVRYAECGDVVVFDRVKTHMGTTRMEHVMVESVKLPPNLKWYKGSA